MDWYLTMVLSSKDDTHCPPLLSRHGTGLTRIRVVTKLLRMQIGWTISKCTE